VESKLGCEPSALQSFSANVSTVSPLGVVPVHAKSLPWPMSAGERHARHVDAAAVELVLDEDLGRVVADLRTHGGDRPAVGAVRRVDQHRVGGVTRQQVQLGEALRPGGQRGAHRGPLRCGRRAADHRVALDDRARVGHGGRRALLARPVTREAL
jgi:hypothetical protein